MASYPYAYGRELYYLNPIPETCPVCDSFIAAAFVEARITEWDQWGEEGEPFATTIHGAYLCARKDCGEMFVVVYRRNEGGGDMRTATYPTLAKAPEILDEIREVSPQFAEIFTQAAAAESYRLTDIAGAGYRKALEYLIKDFAIKEHPDKAANIRDGALARVIDTYVEDGNVKACAKRATWLGNDETHYTRK